MRFQKRFLIGVLPLTLLVLFLPAATYGQQKSQQFVSVDTLATDTPGFVEIRKVDADGMAFVDVLLEKPVKRIDEFGNHYLRIGFGEYHVDPDNSQGWGYDHGIGDFEYFGNVTSFVSGGDDVPECMIEAIDAPENFHAAISNTVHIPYSGGTSALIDMFSHSDDSSFYGLFITAGHNFHPDLRSGDSVPDFSTVFFVAT